MPKNIYTLTSKAPRLNCITDVLLTHTPSGNIRMGGSVGSAAC